MVWDPPWLAVTRLYSMVLEATYFGSLQLEGLWSISPRGALRCWWRVPDSECSGLVIYCLHFIIAYQHHILYLVCPWSMGLSSVWLHDLLLFLCHSHPQPSPHLPLPRSPHLSLIPLAALQTIALRISSSPKGQGRRRFHCHGLQAEAEGSDCQSGDFLPLAMISICIWNKISTFLVFLAVGPFLTYPRIWLKLVNFILMLPGGIFMLKLGLFDPGKRPQGRVISVGRKGQSIDALVPLLWASIWHWRGGRWREGVQGRSGGTKVYQDQTFIYGRCLAGLLGE